MTCRYIDEEPFSLHSPVSPSSSLPHYTASSLPLGRRPPTGCSRVFSLIKPFLSHDFRVVFFTRFVMQLGVLTVQEYLLWYLSDEIGESSPSFPGEKVYIAYGRVVARSEDQAVTLLFAPVLLGAIVSSLVSGLLSDAMGGRRKQLLYISGGIMAFAALLFATTRSFSVDLVLGGIFGVGFGAFSVLDWALAADVLPDPEQVAKVTPPLSHSRTLSTPLRTSLHVCSPCDRWLGCCAGYGTLVTGPGGSAGAGGSVSRLRVGRVQGSGAAVPRL